MPAQTVNPLQSQEKALANEHQSQDAQNSFLQFITFLILLFRNLRTMRRGVDAVTGKKTTGDEVWQSRLDNAIQEEAAKAFAQGRPYEPPTGPRPDPPRGGGVPSQPESSRVDDGLDTPSNVRSIDSAPSASSRAQAAPSGEMKFGFQPGPGGAGSARTAQMTGAGGQPGVEPGRFVDLSGAAQGRHLSSVPTGANAAASGLGAPGAATAAAGATREAAGVAAKAGSVATAGASTAVSGAAQGASTLATLARVAA